MKAKVTSTETNPSSSERPDAAFSKVTGEALLVHLCLYHPHRAWHRAGILRTVNPMELSEEEGEGPGWGLLRKNS